MSPRYGSRLMPVVVDEVAKQQPDLLFASVPLTANVSDGFKGVTFGDIASATNHVAAWIERKFGRSPKFGTIAYMGVGDLRYVVVFLAAVKCGYKVLLTSLRNSSWMNASLLEQTECDILLHSPEVEPIVKPLLDHRPSLQLHPVQALETLVQPHTPHYPYEKSYDESKWDPILILHSSGSTGAPRPIHMNHATFAVGDNDRNLPTVEGRVNQNWSLWNFPNKEHFFSPFPAFHLAGFSSMVMLPIYYNNATLVLSPPTRPPTGHLVSEIMDHFQLKSIFCPPIIAEQLVQEPGGLDKCKSLNFLLYAGGPLSQAAGDALIKVTDVCQFYGQTETGAIQALVPKREDWASLEWHPRQEAYMEPSVDGTFEMVMHRNPALEGVRNISCNFPDVEVWRTKDLFKPHPTKQGLWRFHGRVDDIIVLSNGEKFNPVPSETQIAAHPLLSGALIIGNSRPQACLILEPKDHSQDQAALLEEVYATVEKANEQAPGHARITKGMILVGSKDRPFDRSPKGTVIRNSTGAKYEEEVAGLYTQDISRDVQRLKLGPVHDEPSTTKFVRGVVASSLPSRSFGDEEDLFGLGLDSLQTTEIIAHLKSGITADESGKDVLWITAKFVYEHPSIVALSAAIREQITCSDGVPLTNGSVAKDRKQKLEQVVQKYVQGINPVDNNESVQEQNSDRHVLLTGSTGSLGTQILIKLASDPRVSRISCLDRSANALERVTQALSAWPKKPLLDPSRVTFHQADYSKPDFGLSSEVYTDLHSTITTIIHNAWKVDFNHSHASFEPTHIRGIQNFINFSSSSNFSPRIIFISSISSIGNWHTATQINTESEPIPEKIPPTPAVAQNMGYAESKAIAEQILAAAVTRAGIKTSIVRIGQIAGPIAPDNGGKWNEHEWFPLLLKTSKSLGKIPDGSLMDHVDWVPVDVVASTVVDYMSAENEEALRVYHVVDPATSKWEELIPAVSEMIGGAEAVSMREWVDELAKVDAEDVDAVAAKPAVKILDFFRDMQGSKYIGAKEMKISTVEAQKASPTLGEIGPVRAEWIEQWVRDWGF